ncbi:Solute carrier family 12 member 4 [Eufriesea mexicana]|nr:Solute carrier family 12 member 4 [Eufriesea mexicana]
MKKDLKKFLYDLRIEAEVEIVEMMNSDISAYTYERTLMMEQRNQMLRELRLNKKETLGVVQSLVDFNEVQAIVDHHHNVDVKVATKETKEENEEETKLIESKKPTITPDEGDVKRMHTSIKLNEVIVKKSKNAQLVILNLPGPPRDTKMERESNYMEFLEVLTEGLERVLMVRGGGREVITIYS